MTKQKENSKLEILRKEAKLTKQWTPDIRYNKNGASPAQLNAKHKTIESISNASKTYPKESKNKKAL